MRVKAATVQKFLLGMALLSALLWNLSQASEIKGLQLSEGATGTRAEIALDAAGDYRVLRLANPNRLAVDLPASSLTRGLRPPAPAGIVRAVRTGEPSAGTVRIVFDLAEAVTELKPRIETGAEGARLVIEWPGDGVAASTAGAAAPAAQSPAANPTHRTMPSAAPSGEPAVASASSVAGASTTVRDPAAASAEATSRLISEIVARNAAASAPAPSATAPSASAPSASNTTTATAAVTTTAAPAAVPAGSAPSNEAPSSPAGVRIATGVPTPTTSGSEPGAPPADAVKTMKDVMRGRGMRPLVIAIDAGHGGQDPGAIGLAGRREKDITLSIARELARQVNATPGLKAYLTRDNDVFLPLNQRARLARQARADMFVSIHADAAENRSAHGSSVYVLSLKGASSQRARWLADKENASDLIGGVRLEKTNDTLASVLLDLTQSGHMRASEDAAGHVLKGLGKLGRNHKPHVERANFAVLRTSDMPAMLVETAFISNPDEEKRLSDPAHQRALARAVLDGVNAYFLRQPPPGTLYAARAAAEPVANAGGAGGSP